MVNTILDTAAPDEAREPYYAEGVYVRKQSVQTQNADGSSSFTLDFRCCKASDEVGEEGAKTIALLMNRGDSSTARILDLEAKLAALTTVAEDAKALLKAALLREANLEERLRVMREAADQARILIGAQNDSATDVQKECNHNKAWWLLQDALIATADAGDV